MTTVRVDRGRLHASLSELKRFTGSGTFADIHVSVADRLLSVAATDRSRGLRVSMECDSDGHERFSVGSRLSDVVRALIGDELTLTIDGGMDVRGSGKATFNLPLGTHAIDDDLWSFEGEPSAWDMDRSMATIVEVAKFAAKDEKRPVISGPQLSSSDGGTTVSSTDSFRFCRVQLDEEVPLTGHTLPRVAVLDLSRSFSGSTNISIGRRLTVGSNDVDGQSTTYFCRIYDGAFPDFDRVLPDVEKARMVVAVDNSVLVDAVSRVSVVSVDRRPVVFDASGTTLRLHCGGDDGVVDDEVDVEVYGSGDPFPFALNSGHLLSMLPLAGDEVRLVCDGPNRPVRIESDGRHVMMIAALRVPSS